MSYLPAASTIVLPGGSPSAAWQVAIDALEKMPEPRLLVVGPGDCAWSTDSSKLHCVNIKFDMTVLCLGDVHAVCVDPSPGPAMRMLRIVPDAGQTIRNVEVLGGLRFTYARPEGPGQTEQAHCVMVSGDSSTDSWVEHVTLEIVVDRCDGGDGWYSGKNVRFLRVLARTRLCSRSGGTISSNSPTTSRGFYLDLECPPSEKLLDLEPSTNDARIHDLTLRGRGGSCHLTHMSNALITGHIGPVTMGRSQAVVFRGGSSWSGPPRVKQKADGTFHKGPGQTGYPVRLVRQPLDGVVWEDWVFHIDPADGVHPATGAALVGGLVSCRDPDTGQDPTDERYDLQIGPSNSVVMRDDQHLEDPDGFLDPRIVVNPRRLAHS